MFVALSSFLLLSRKPDTILGISVPIYVSLNHLIYLSFFFFFMGTAQPLSLLYCLIVRMLTFEN